MKKKNKKKTRNVKKKTRKKTRKNQKPVKRKILIVTGRQTEYIVLCQLVNVFCIKMRMC